MFKMQRDDAALCLLKVLQWPAAVCSGVREPLSFPPGFITRSLPVCTDLYWSILDYLQFLEFHAVVHLLPFEYALLPAGTPPLPPLWLIPHFPSSFYTSPLGLMLVSLLLDGLGAEGLRAGVLSYSNFDTFCAWCFVVVQQITLQNR